MTSLFSQEVFFKNLFDAIPLITLIVAANGQIQGMNDAAKNFIKNAANTEYYQKLGGEVFDCIHVQDDPRGCPFGSFCLNCDLRINSLEALKGNSIVRAKGKMTIQQNQEIRDLCLLISAGPLDYGNERFAVVIIEDVTEQQKVETELFKTQKLESIGILAGGIAHDFNNNLTAIIANLQLAKIKLEKGYDIQKYIDETVRMVYKASSLTKQLLSFSKGGAPIREAARISELLQDTINFALRGSKVKCIFDIPSDLWSAEIDEGQISQVISNITFNADQAMPDGGVINVYAANVTLNNSHGFPLDAGDYLKISIEDHGVGIPSEHFQKIFDPFFTTKVKGTGLGLTTSYAIIQRHEGFIDVESSLGIGTTFHIYLPATQKKLIPRAIEEPRVYRNEGHLLLLDDEEWILDSVGQILQESGFQVTLTRDGAEAVQLYKQAIEKGAPFDAVIMDLTISGGVGGKAAIRQLLEIDPRVKAIVSSGYSTDPVMANYREYGFCGVIAKPYQFNELHGLLNQVLSSV